MGFLEKIRKFFDNKEILEKKEYNFETARKLIEKELEVIDENQKKRVLEANKSVLEAISNLDESIIKLRNINLNDRKEDQRIKSVVAENLSQFTEQTVKLKVELTKLEKNESYLENIERILANFNRMTKTSYQKATILVGKELEEVKLMINEIVTKIKPLYSDNLSDKDKKNKIKTILEDYKKLENLEKDCSSVDEIIKQKEENLKEIRLKIEKIDEDLKGISQTKEYQKEQQEKEKKKKDIENNDKEISEIKERINFKSLSKKYHSDEDNMEIITKYADNFKKKLIEENIEDLVEFLEKENINIDIRELKNRTIDILKVIPSKIDEKIKEMNERKQRLDYEMNNIRKEIHSFNKEKIQMKIEEIRKDIKDSVEKLMNIEIKDL